MTEIRRFHPASLERTAEEVRDELLDGDVGGALRQVIQFLDDLAGEDTATVQSAICIEPGTTGDERWDALLAGIAEYVGHRAQLLTPAWASNPARFLGRFWFVIESILGREAPGLAVMAFVSSPPELLSRGVVLDRASLVSV